MKVYSAESPLRQPRTFFSDALSDLKVALAAGRRLFARGLQARYRQTWLRYLWLVVPAVGTTLVWLYLDRAGIVGFDDTELPYVAYVASGFVLWQLFMDALNTPLRLLQANRDALTKARLPHESWFVAAGLDAAFSFTVRLLPLGVLLAALDVRPGAGLLLVPLGALAVLLLGLAVGLVLTPVGLLYEDVEHGLTVILGIGFFLTPIVYAHPRDGASAQLIELNPLTPLVEMSRAWMTGGSGEAAVPFVAVAVAAACLLALALVVFRVAQPHLVDRL